MPEEKTKQTDKIEKLEQEFPKYIPKIEKVSVLSK